MSIENWPAMPPEITRDGPYRVYKGRQYTVYDDGHSAETPYQTDRADALEARLRDTAAALQAVIAWAAPMKDAPRSARPQWFDDARAILTQLRTEGLT